MSLDGSRNLQNMTIFRRNPCENQESWIFPRPYLVTYSRYQIGIKIKCKNLLAQSRKKWYGRFNARFMHKTSRKRRGFVHMLQNLGGGVQPESRKKYVQNAQS